MKSREAFRTISEVSDWLDTPAHVLRFWESKFVQIRPVKRAGGRRYYRPEDMALLGGIKTLLHEQGMTIKGVQKLLREKGIRHVAALGPQPLESGGEFIDLGPEDMEPEAPPMPEVVALPRRIPVPQPLPAATAPVQSAAATRPAPVAPSARAPASAPVRLPPALRGAIAAADTSALRARAARIAPLLDRLQAVRDRMARTA